MTHRIAILGASGYTGAELVRLIATHPDMQIVVGGGIFNRAPGLDEEIGADLSANSPRDLLEKLVSEGDARNVRWTASATVSPGARNSATHPSSRARWSRTAMARLKRPIAAGCGRRRKRQSRKPSITPRR